ncbi:LiaF transmembrane domain-containing protein [Bacillus sp. KH172YL63]|uniref:LiaF transmembrane domain-containing protein n=1 Tax=Bacillus sp. KH172YL63 TaxID=2709784 RepID=UPI0013E4A2DA|nr:DUF5668 domain-containing protein [Bacillus sp. KH172YL63]BCB02651.1 hypothetical protein KH172YL63_07840 [Bacillus sp. KH172YL63]
MRTWRVGSISMGTLLLFLGVLLLLSQLAGWDSSHVLAGWWPVLLIVLGAEILVYLFQSKEEKPLLKYDFLSILFVGFIGMIGIGFTVLQATGLMDQVHRLYESEVKTGNLPVYEHKVGDDIKRIVVRAEHQPLTVETNTGKELSVFGTYRSDQSGKGSLLSGPEDYLMAKEKGDTLYITLKSLPETNGWIQARNEMEPTLIVPASVSLEISGDYNEITLKPRTLSSSWAVSSVSIVNLLLSSTENANISAENVGSIHGEDENWQPAQTAEAEAGEGDYSDGSGYHSGTLTLGNGQHPITITNADQLNVSIKD